MNSKRAMGWVAFFGVAAALAWLPDYLKQAGDGEADVAAVATPAKGKTHGELAAASASGAPAAIKDLSPAGDLFAPAAGRLRRPWPASPNKPSTSHRWCRSPLHRRCLSSSLAAWMYRTDLQVFFAERRENLRRAQRGCDRRQHGRSRDSDMELSLVYLPLHLSQTLSVGSAQ